MRKILTLSFIFCAVCLIGQERYLEPTFTDVDVQQNVVYGANYTVLTIPVTGSTTLQPLIADVYSPAGDTETDRPLILMLHTGNFLPQLVNGQINGTIRDEYLVDIATRLTKLGYVVASVDYRQGWDPLNPSQEVRTNTLINASYRGIQDLSSCVRFFRKTVAEDGNPFGINPDKVVTWGLGTGSYVNLGQATIDQYFDIVLPKFIGSDINGDGTPDPMVIEFINGDPFGETVVGLNPLNGDTLAIPNTPGYSSEVQLAVNLGGAMGDTSWLDTTDPPIISFQCPKDPFAPYLQDILIVPTTGDLVVEVAGAGVFQPKANAIGNHDEWIAAGFDDTFTMAAAASSNLEHGTAYEGLFPIQRPTWDLDGDGTGETEEGSPWEWWDPAFWSMSQPQQCTDAMIPLEQCNWDLVSRANNPDMTFDKASAYIDSIIGYFAPRAYLTLDLGAAPAPDCDDVLGAYDAPAIIPLPSGVGDPAEGWVGITTDAKVGEPYSHDWTFYFPNEFFNPVVNGMVISKGQTFYADSVSYIFNGGDRVDGLPAGLSLTVNPEDGIMPARDNGPAGCITLSGTPDASLETGNYQIIFRMEICVDVPSLGQTDFCQTVDVPGALSGFNGEYSLFIEGTSSVTNLNDKVAVNIMPNPITDNAVVEINGFDNADKGTFKVLSIDGRVIYREVVTNVNSNMVLNLNANQFNNGMYLYQFETEQGRVTGKVLIQK